MTCSSCAHENPAGAKFCEQCGAALGRACPSCGLELRPAVRFCSECGTPVSAGGATRPPPRVPAASSVPTGETRKTVTIVFADLVGSTALHERLDPESARRFMESYYEVARGAVESHGGSVTQLLGDGVKAVFGIPRVAEDDAIRAVRAAVAMQDGFRALAEQQRGAVGQTGLRVAVNTGEVVADDETEIIGDPVNVAARLQEQGGDGDVVVGESTARLVGTLVTLAPLGSFALKGRAETVAAFRVESLERPASATTAAFVGRDEELARINAVYARAVEKPATALAVLLGSPGLGKSRLIDEFVHRLGDAASVVEAHCDEAGSATFAPLALALRALLGIEAGASGEALRTVVEVAIPHGDPDAARIAGGIAALLAGSPESLEEAFFVVRRLLGALASERPVVLVIDDLQWAEPLLLDLVEHLVEWGSGVRLLVLVAARPELRDKRAALATPGGLVADVVTLAGLDAGAATRLAANVIGAADLPAAVAAKVLVTSEGNPLFVGELVRMLVHEGALTREGDRWTTGTALAALDMPPTIHALLAARIERLRPEERVVLERAAVVGRHFSRSAVAELLPPDVADLDARLESLGRSELIERDSGWFLGEPVLRFHHGLVRDAAYRQLLKGTRAELHTRFADWVLARPGDALDHDETIGWHLEQAHRFLRELGPIDAAGRAIGERASTHLAAAGRRALAGDDVALAASLLGRAIERLDPDEPARAELALDWCEALLAAGDVGAATSAIDELGRFVGDSERLRAWHTCFAGQRTVLTTPEGLQVTAETVAAAAGSLAALGDAAGEANGHFVCALGLARLGKIGACEAALDRALAAARRVAGDRRRANTVLAVAPLAALWGPSPVARASGRCLDVVRVLRITQGAPAVEAVALSCQGVLEALRGRADAARRMIAAARTMVEELGITRRLLEVDLFSGLVDLLEGDAVAAERHLRAAYEGMRELGLGIDAARAAALLARTLLAQDRVPEAEALSHESEALAGDDLKAAIAWRGVRAEALARRGEHAAAVEFARRGVEIAAATDALLDHADARLALAAALRAAGRGREADVEERRASQLWEAKGATVFAARAASAASDGVHVGSGAALSEQSATAPPPAPRRVRPNAETAIHARIDAAVAAHDVDAVSAQFSEGRQEIDHPTGSTYGPDEAQAAPVRRSVRPTVATAAIVAFETAFAARDDDALGALFDDGLTVIDHPNGATYGRAGHLDSLRRLARANDSELRFMPLAGLGDALCLAAREIVASGTVSRHFDVAAWERREIVLFETDGQGRVRHLEVFGADALGAALVRVYERHAEMSPEGPERVRATTTAGVIARLLGLPDLEAWCAGWAPTIEFVDHRILGVGTLRGADALRDYFRAMFGLEDFTIDVDDILRLQPGAMLFRTTTAGTARAGGGIYERPLLNLLVFGGDGLVTRLEHFDPEREVEALARFAAIALGEAQGPFAAIAKPNAASAAMDRWQAAYDVGFDADEWDPTRRLCVPECVFEDRRRMALLSGDLELMIAAARERVAMGARPQRRLVGTAGDRIGIERMLWSGGPAGGRFEIEYLALFEVDASGLFTAFVIFDCEDPRAAQREAWARWAAVEPWVAGVVTPFGEAVDAFNEQDPVKWRAAFADDLVVEDHRLAGMGRIDGADAYTASIVALWNLAPVTHSEAGWHWPAFERHGAITVVRRTGTVPDGGDFESEHLYLYLVAESRITHVEMFEIHALDEARARLEALRPGPHHIPPNAAVRTLARLYRAGSDGTAVRKLACPEFVFEDRGKRVLVTGDVETLVGSIQYLLLLPGVYLDAPLLGTVGERVAVHHTRWYGNPGGAAYEFERIRIVEVDAEGLLRGMILFDPDDRAAAFAEAQARFLVGEAAGIAAQGVFDKFIRAWSAKDWAGTRAWLAEDIVIDDHRKLSFGRIGRDAWIESWRVGAEMAPDVSGHAIRILAWNEHGRVAVYRVFGTRDGGEFENVFIMLSVADATRVRHFEFFEVEDADRAVARFESLAAAAPPDARVALVKPNAASAAIVRWRIVFDACVASGDWEAPRALFAQGHTFEDRQRMSLVSGDSDLQIASMRERGEMGARSDFTQVGTAGDRVAVLRMLWSGGPPDGRFEIEHLVVVEVDASGLFTATVLLDPDDTRGAQREAWARWASIDPIAAPWVRLLTEIADAWNGRDKAGIRARVASNLVVEDHRHAGLGRIEGADAYVASNVALWELAPDQRIEFGSFWPVIDRHVALVTLRREGTLTDGGAFENDYLWLGLVEGGVITRLEFFEIDALHAALARFEELRAKPSDPAEGL